MAVAAGVLFAGCTGGEEGTANTAPIRAETTVVVTTVAAVVASVPVDSVPPASVAPLSSVPTPVGEDYRVPVVVKFVPTTDAEREVLAAATELFTRFRRFELTEEKRAEVLQEVLIGKSFEEWIPNATTGLEVRAVPSKSDRVVIESIKLTGTHAAEVNTCWVDGATLFVRNESGEFVLDDAELATLVQRFELDRTTNGWRISVDELLDRRIGVDKCGK